MGSRAAVVHLHFRAGSTFPIPVCTVPSSMDRTSRCSKVDVVRLYASYRLNLLKKSRGAWGMQCFDRKLKLSLKSQPTQVNLQLFILNIRFCGTWSVHDLYMICTWSVYDLYMICIWSEHDLYMICTWSVHDRTNKHPNIEYLFMYII